MASESGALIVDPKLVKEHGRLKAGRMFVVDLSKGRIISDEELINSDLGLDRAKRNLARSVAGALVPYIQTEVNRMARRTECTLSVGVVSPTRILAGSTPVVILTSEEYLKLNGQLNKLTRVAHGLVDAINNTGGLTAEDGPVADPEWTDLVDVYTDACVALGCTPVVENNETEEEA
jgi:hypothetical protein